MVIKLLQKKDRDKRFIKNWRPISLLNIDTKILLKVFAATVKRILLSIISLDHNFLQCVLRNFGFDDNFITWIKMILNDQQSCVINGGFATQYFTLKKGAHQVDSRSTYLFYFCFGSSLDFNKE